MKINKICNSMKKHYRNILSTALVLSMAAGWWGILYPQLTLNGDTCRIVTENGEAVLSEEEGWEADNAVYMEILNADRSKLRFRCRFVEDILEYLERVRRN